MPVLALSTPATRVVRDLVTGGIELLAKPIGAFLPEVALVSGDFVSVRVLQNEKVQMTRHHPRRQLSPGRSCSKELSRVVVHLNINLSVCRPLPADVVVRSDPDASVPLLNAAGSSVIAAAVSCLVVAKLLAAGPASASPIAVHIAIGIRAAVHQAVLISGAVTRVRVVAWTITLPIAAEPAVRGPRLQRLFQTKRHQRLGRNIHAFAPGQDLSTGSRCRANAAANRRTFSAAGNGADDRTDRCPAANEFTSALVGSETVRLES